MDESIDPLGEKVSYGLSANLNQILHQLVQVFFIGMMLGMTRTVIPVLAEKEFGIQKGSFLLMMTFILAFGFVKATLNFIAGSAAESLGRKKVLLIGWLIAAPIPHLIYYAKSWNWIVVATILLGINQGLAWSMTQTSKLDLTTADQRGLVVGLNEFVGYTGMAIAGLLSAKLTAFYGVREGLFLFGTAMIGFAGLLSITFIKDTRPWARHPSRSMGQQHYQPRYCQNVSLKPSSKELFVLMLWKDKRMLAISQAGLIEKFVDALIWAFYPIYLYEQQLSLDNIAWIISIYGISWGVFQLFTGYLSDRIGRKLPITLGMLICGFGVLIGVYADQAKEWAISSAIMGIGMALFYPTLLAAVSDISEPHWRGGAIGMYRFIRDLGYGIGAILLGLIATFYISIESAFWFTGFSMLGSGLVFHSLFEETHPKLNPA